jgi:ppGpp synthetase/RelA/SpoT-type nucleotidyltranferase
MYELEDKSRNLGTNRIGYRTIHLVVSLSNTRTILPEYSEFDDLKFEIQLRTILEHAWAEIEHDRNYKFKGSHFYMYYTYDYQVFEEFKVNMAAFPGQIESDCSSC